MIWRESGFLRSLGLQFCNPHLEVKLIVQIIVALLAGSTIDMVQIEGPELVKAVVQMTRGSALRARDGRSRRVGSTGDKKLTWKGLVSVCYAPGG